MFIGRMNIILVIQKISNMLFLESKPSFLLNVTGTLSSLSIKKKSLQEIYEAVKCHKRVEKIRSLFKSLSSGNEET